MPDDRQREAEQIFKELLAFPATLREIKLRARCADDELAEEVRGLLAFAREGDGPLDESAPSRLGLSIDDAPLLPAGQVIGRYTLVRVLGEGGMGVVYVAEQERPKRTVALKVIRPGMASASMLRRFEYEAEILGKLQHPGIAQVIEAGVADLGAAGGRRPFLAMELIDGEHIAAYIAHKKLSIRERAELFVRVCEGVEHAHQRGVIHRDLKPANILVDRSGQPKILDFGVARAAEPGSDDARLTNVRPGFQPLIGTLAYMSPEQVAGSQAAVDTRTDVYSLGVTLFELVTGRLPHDLDDRSAPEAARTIRDDEPAAPSTFSPECRGDLETIILKALEKDRDHRYQSAADLAADLRRLLSDRPIAARPPTTMYQVRKFAKRNRKFVAALAIAAAALVLGFAGTVSGLVRARHGRDQAMQARQISEDATDFFLAEMVSSAMPTTPEVKNITLATAIRAAAKRAPDRFARDAPTRQRVLDGLGESLYALGEYGEAIPCFRGALAACEEAYGPGSGRCVRPLLALANALDALGLHGEGNERRAQAAALAARELPATDVDALDARGAVLYMSVFGNDRDAEGEIRSLLREYESAGHGESDLYNNLSEALTKILLKKGRRDEAFAIWRDLIEQHRRRWGPRHADTLVSTFSFVRQLYESGMWDEALERGQQTLAEMAEVYDPAHVHLLYARQSMSEVLLSVGRSDEALAQIQQCMPYLAAAYKDSPLNRAKYDVVLVKALCANGRAGEALDLAARSYGVHRECFSDDHYAAIDSMTLYGYVLAFAPGLESEGMSLMRQGIDALEAQGRPANTTRWLLAETLFRLGHVEEAASEQAAVLELCQQADGAENPRTRKMAERLAAFRSAAASPR